VSRFGFWCVWQFRVIILDAESLEAAEEAALERWEEDVDQFLQEDGGISSVIIEEIET
jgi:hypothetical protein